jgi:transposase
MNDSLLYQAYGIRNYSYASTAYKDNAIYLHVKTKITNKVKCPRCGSYHVIRYGVVRRTLHNLPFGSKPCFLSLQVQRFCCKDCASAWQADIPFAHGGVSYTYRFKCLVLDLLRLGMTIKDVARHLRVGWNMVKDIHKKYLKQKYSCPNIKRVQRIGIDEFAIHKGHAYKTIVVDFDTGRIIHVGEGKGKDALDGFWKRVRKYNVRIKVVTSDLSGAFISSVMENAPEAVHVYDKFHVVKLMNDAVDSVRRKVYAQETDLVKRNIIKGSRWLLLSKGKDIFDKKSKSRLDNILKTNEPLFHAYYLKEDLDLLWKQKNKEEAEKQLRYWCERARETKLQPLIKVANSLMARRTGLLAWYDVPITNAMLEGINNKIKVMKRRAYGYRDDEYFRLLLLGMKDETNAIRG